MKKKSGLCELVVAITLCAGSAANGDPWWAGLYLAFSLMLIASLPTLFLNYRALPATFRCSFLNCIVLPYSTLLVLLPRILMLPLADHLMFWGPEASGESKRK